MGLNVPLIQSKFPDLLPYPLVREKGTIAYQLRLPAFPPGREFSWAELTLPKGFPNQSKATIRLSPDAVLRVPHVDGDSVLCTEVGDPGPGLGYTPEERIFTLLYTYHERFLRPWLRGDLDNDFETEALNYWAIEVIRSRSNFDAVRSVWTVDACPKNASVRKGLLLMPQRIVIAADEQLTITNRIVQCLGPRAQQRIGVLVADIPISHGLVPTTWPRTIADLDRILISRLPPQEYAQLQSPRSRRGRRVHRIVLMRNPELAFAYLLPDGPPTVVCRNGKNKAYPPKRKPLPLSTTRLDPNWTVGRDQLPIVSERQLKHVLVIGVGALGSAIVDHLAKAGVGRLSIIDSDNIASANIGRHLLGAESIGQKKVEGVAQRINISYPATIVIPYATTFQQWLGKHSLLGIDVVLDLTGEPNVRVQLDQARRERPCPLMIAWMEPYVAAAHVCLLLRDQSWIQESKDSLSELQAVTWPDDVIQREPGCSSQFQSYTAAAAAHAIALVAENSLKLIDDSSEVTSSLVVSWVRGQQYLDRCRPNLQLRGWAQAASAYDGMTLTRLFP